MHHSATAGRRDPRRVVHDARGVRWEVFEHTPDYDRRGVPTLVFMSAEVVRRVRNFPADWAELADAELLAVAAQM